MLLFKKQCYICKRFNHLKINIMKSDYRKQFIGWDSERIEKHLIYLKEKLLQSIGICDSNSEYYLKRISYLSKKLNSK